MTDDLKPGDPVRIAVDGKFSAHQEQNTGFVWVDTGVGLAYVPRSAVTRIEEPMSDTIKPGTRVKATLGESVIVGEAGNDTEDEWVTLLVAGEEATRTIYTPPWTVTVIEPAEVLVEGAWYVEPWDDHYGAVAVRRTGLQPPWNNGGTDYPDGAIRRPLTRLIPASDVEAMVERIAERWKEGRESVIDIVREEAAKLLGGCVVTEPTTDEWVYAVRCPGTLGSKPWWMGWGQYDPCPCLLPAGHEGSHECAHTKEESAKVVGP